MEGKKLLTTQEVAQDLGVTDSYIRKLIRTGKASPAQQIGGTWLFSQDEVERLRHRKRTRGPDKKQ